MFKVKCVAFLFCLISTIANAEPFNVNRAMICDKVSEVFKILVKYNEKVIWQGKNDSELTTMLTLNSTTQTWSLIVSDKEFACLLDSGQGFSVAGPSSAPSPKPQSDKKQDSKNLVDINFVQ